MTQGFVQVAPDSTGKQLGNEVYTVPVGTVLTDGSGNQTVTSAPLYFFREHVVNADPTNPAGVATVTQGPQPTEYGLTTRIPQGQPDFQAMLVFLQDIDAVLNQIAGNPGPLGGQAPPGLLAVRSLIKTPLLSPTAPLPVLADGFGRLLAGPPFGRNNTDAASVTITSSTVETNIQAADPNNFNDLMAIIISNTSATAVRVDVRDQPSTVTAPSSSLGVMPFFVPAGDMRGIAFPQPNYQSNYNQPWTATCSASVADVRIWAFFAQTPRGY